MKHVFESPADGHLKTDRWAASSTASFFAVFSVCVCERETYFILHSCKIYNTSIASQALSSQAIMSSVFPAELDMQHFHQRTNNCMSCSIVFSFPPDAPNRRAAYFSMATCWCVLKDQHAGARAAHAWMPACLLVLTSSSLLEMKWYTRELSHDGDAARLSTLVPTNLSLEPHHIGSHPVGCCVPSVACARVHKRDSVFILFFQL